MSATRGLLRNIVRECVAAEAGALALPPASAAPKVDPVGHPIDSGVARMSRGALFNIASRAQSLHDRLEDDDHLPEWVRSKLAAMLDDMHEIEDHLGYKLHRQELEN